MAAGLLLVRLVFGGLMAAHGSQKLFGWLGGYGLTGTGTFFEQLGFRPGRLFAAAAGMTEVLGGVLVAVGVGGPIGPAFMVSVMLVAVVSVHWGHGCSPRPTGSKSRCSMRPLPPPSPSQVPDAIRLMHSSA